MYLLRSTSQFDRRFRRFGRAHPELKQSLGQVFHDLEADPFMPRLRLHSLAGELRGLHAVSLSYAYRIVLTISLSEQEILLLDIDTHDEV